MAGEGGDVRVTSILGAVARAVATNRGLLNDPFAEPLVRAAGVEYFARVIENERFAADDGDNPVLAALIDIVAAYTRVSDEFLAEAGRAGIRQAVILLPGLDTRCYRLWWPHGTMVYEIDEPGVLDVKSEALRALGAGLTTNRCAVGVELDQDWPAALRRAGFDAAAPTVWIAEGVFVGNLPPERQHRLLDDVSALSASGSRLAADHMPAWTPLQLEAERVFVDGWRRQGIDVDLHSLTRPGEYRDVPEDLAAHGWDALQRNISAVLAAMGPTTTPRIGRRGANLAPQYVTATRR